MTRKWMVAFLLLGGIAACIALLPWSQWLAAGPGPDRSRLEARLARYTELRLKDDWVAMYEMLDAKDRQVVPLIKYLAHYGTGALKVLQLHEKHRSIDAAKGAAAVEWTLDGEMQLSRVDPRFLRGMQEIDRSALRKQGEFVTDWTWRDGDWWLRVDRQVITGRTTDGRAIQTVRTGEPAADAPPASNRGR